ncbi:class I SAM-dependent methyltransferase [Kitasatospora purpeofusca]|uniref:class I SAM-dependent methyltransferase n=1 Tax=Kitasatospora purpeofusca TaxID=67352 RepID=UPI0036541835
MNRAVRSVDDVLDLLDGLFRPEADRWTDRAADWWDGFYADRSSGRPFFVDKPDENLVARLDGGLLPPGARVLDLGCGAGRNAVHLASLGFEVDAVDLSATALDWARERAEAAGVAPRFHHGNIFSTELPLPQYDLVYDSGCLHHLPPHRRISYLALLERVLAPGGYFGLTCFAAGEMGSELPDAALYRNGRLDGGLAFTPDELRWIFAGFAELEIRPMVPQEPASPLFGLSVLLTALFRRPLADRGMRAPRPGRKEGGQGRGPVGRSAGRQR